MTDETIPAEDTPKADVDTSAEKEAELGDQVQETVDDAAKDADAGERPTTEGDAEG